MYIYETSGSFAYKSSVYVFEDSFIDKCYGNYVDFHGY